MANFTGYNSKNEALQTAYEQGCLLVHQLEFPDVELTGEAGKKFTDFIRVLSGKSGSRFQSSYRDISGDSGGYPCLATTFLSSETKNDTFTLYNKVGFLLDGNNENVKYIGASLRDLNSHFNEDKQNLCVFLNLDKPGKAIWDKQFAELENSYNIDLSKLELGTKRNAVVKEAMQEITAYNKNSNNPKINEVLVNANTKAICGIVLSSYSHNAGHLIDALESFRHDIAPLNALALKGYMKEVFGVDLPVKEYNLFAKDGIPLKDMNISRDEFLQIKQEVIENTSGTLTPEQLDVTLKYAERGFKLQQRVQKAEIS